MTAPRQILPGTTYLVTRRCSERRFFLRPSRRTNDIFGYVLAVAASRYEIRVHAYCVLSNHFHLVVTDPHARLPEFHRYLDGLVARALNCALGRWEAFWDPDSYSAVRLETADAVLEKMVYVLANPVAAGLVRRGCEWPGLWSGPRTIGAAPVPFDRPKEFFRDDGHMPAAAGIQLELPPGFEADASFHGDLEAGLRAAEEDAAAQLGGQGRAWIGVARVLSQEPSARPATGEPRRNLSPLVAVRNKWKRVEVLARLAEFRRAYREALLAWKAGSRDVRFPPGTWQMRVHHAAACTGLA
jgi:REP element-mobilizing transposase RayT